MNPTQYPTQYPVQYPFRRLPLVQDPPRRLVDTEMLLIVDPNPRGCREICGLFGRAGYVCIPAHDPIDAVCKVDRYPDVEVAIIDARTPALAGMAQQLRAKRPELVLVGQGEAHHRQTFETLGIGCFLPKPWVLADFLSLDGPGLGTGPPPAGNPQPAQVRP